MKAYSQYQSVGCRITSSGVWHMGNHTKYHQGEQGVAVNAYKLSNCNLKDKLKFDFLNRLLFVDLSSFKARQALGCIPVIRGQTQRLLIIVDGCLELTEFVVDQPQPIV